MPTFCSQGVYLYWVENALLNRLNSNDIGVSGIPNICHSDLDLFTHLGFIFNTQLLIKYNVTISWTTSVLNNLMKV